MTLRSPRDRRSKAWSASLGILLLLGARTADRGHREFVGSYLVQAADYSVAVSSVKHANGIVTHELPIINSVAADLSPAQLRALEQDSRVKIIANRTVRVSQTASVKQLVQPYVVERTNANLLHAQGITGRGVVI